VVRFIATHLDEDTESAAAERSLASLRLPSAVGTTICERLPAHVWPRVPSEVRDRISRGVREAFDPHYILNPGILGEEG
jgi:hypothetical protein